MVACSSLYDDYCKPELTLQNGGRRFLTLWVHRRIFLGAVTQSGLQRQMPPSQQHSYFDEGEEEDDDDDEEEEEEASTGHGQGKRNLWLSID